MRYALALVPIVLLAGCGQEIIVLDCDGHVPGDSDGGNTTVDAGFDDFGNPIDSGLRTDAGPLPDAGPVPDGGFPDSGPQDSGVDPCPGGSPYCISGITLSQSETTVRTQVTLTPTLDRSATVTWRVDPAGLTSHRRANLPALNRADITYSLVIDPGTGVASFIVNEVPTWFATTTFVIRIYAKGPNAPDPEVFRDAEVTVKGNIVVSGSADVYAIASDGRPAHSVNFTQGRLLSTSSFVRTVEDLLMARDGSLLVYDSGQTPPRLRRFELIGENALANDFDFQDVNMAPYITTGESGRGITQLPNGEVALLVYDFGNNPASRIVIWNEDGSYARSLLATNTSVQWSGLAVSDAGELVTVEHTSNGNMLKLNPATGAINGNIATSISNAYNVVRAKDGNYYLGLTEAVIRVTPTGSRQMVSALPVASLDYWQFLTPFGLSPSGEGIMAATRDYSSSDNNIGLITGTQWNAWFRVPQSGGPSVLPQGIAYLD